MLECAGTLRNSKAATSAYIDMVRRLSQRQNMNVGCLAASVAPARPSCTAGRAVGCIGRALNMPLSVAQLQSWRCTLLTAPSGVACLLCLRWVGWLLICVRTAAKPPFLLSMPQDGTYVVEQQRLRITDTDMMQDLNSDRKQ